MYRANAGSQTPQINSDANWKIVNQVINYGPTA
jgi:hypothetical protein